MTSVLSETTRVAVDSGQRRRLLDEWATGVEPSDVVGIARLLRRGWTVPVVRPAVHSGGESLDYGELFARVRARAGATTADGVGAAVRLLAMVAAHDGSLIRLGDAALTARAVAVAVADRRAVAAERRWERVDPAVGFAEVRLVVAPWDSVCALIELLAAVADGATLVVPTPAERDDPVALAELIAARSVTHVVAPATSLSELRGVTRLPGVRRWDVVGTRCPATLCARLRALSPDAVASFGYTLPVYAGAVARGPLDGSGRARPIPGARLLVLDDYGQPVPPGVVGEVYAGGAALMEDRDRPAASRFVADPFPVEGIPPRLYRTGARARWSADGWLVLEDEFEGPRTRRIMTKELTL
ncbi:AMP-binding protein [Nocardia blacklockiae]|uniref:AMP-binding protein n=1 Tax=Nocardia blacklockiae TaxID=480036 RepID=UPI0018938941|nr:AMP-binding protein [Nocardia blacklockiae]MBF6171471.1 AMP-binding protein [Nocardia blacklockiae]